MELGLQKVFTERQGKGKSRVGVVEYCPQYNKAGSLKTAFFIHFFVVTQMVGTIQLIFLDSPEKKTLLCVSWETELSECWMSKEGDLASTFDDYWWAVA